MEYLLIVAMWAGTLSRSDSSAITSQVMTSQATCEAAGKAAVAAFTTMMKTVAYTCTVR